MAIDNRLEALRERHSILDRQVMEITSRPYYDTVKATRIKMDKLRIKEEIARLTRH